MPLLRIQEITDFDNNSSISHTFRIFNASNGRCLTQSLPVSLSPAENEELRWYLEEYAEKDPFMTSRAAAAAAILVHYGSNLLSAVDWKAMLTHTELQQPLTILVEEPDSHLSDTSTKSYIAHVFWELLERRDLWSLSLHPPIIAVLRTISKFQQPTIIPAVNPHGRPLNVLIVVARPAGDQDIPHRLVSQIILDTVPGDICVDVSCPGTFEAFETSLKNKGIGYYNMVHFDLHGFEDSSGRCVKTNYAVMYKLINSWPVFIWYS
jgi:hypothetical protein